MSAQQLADATAALGYPVPRSVVANLESGRRESIGIAELLVLARVLDVSPLTLVLPLGRASEVEVLPGASVRTWDAARWFAGQMPLPGGLRGQEWVDVRRWIDSPVALFRAHDELVDAVLRTNERARAAVERGDDVAATVLELLDVRLDQLKLHRGRMRAVRVEPGPVPEGVPLHVADDGEELLVFQVWDPRGER
jgi:hypothetical protein